MTRCAETFMRQSGVPSDISFSDRKTKTKNQMNPPPLPSKQPSLFANNFVFEPMPDPGNPIRALENLLKYPGRIVYELHQTRAAILGTWLVVFGIAGIAI